MVIISSCPHCPATTYYTLLLMFCKPLAGDQNPVSDGAPQFTHRIGIVMNRLEVKWKSRYKTLLS